jgi:glyoxylase-like metal-dependent hydrolase (beta-lactamase superfamily II)
MRLSFLTHASVLACAILLLSPGSEVFSQTVPAYEVYAVSYGRAEESIPLSSVAVGADPSQILQINCMFWFLKGSDGRNILVDTGFLRDSPHFLSYPLTIIDYVRPDSALARLGIQPEDVTDIVLTHLHWDHADGISLFPIANVWIQRAEFEYYTGDARQVEEEPSGVDARDIIQLVEVNTQGRLRFIEGDGQKIYEGITAYTGPKHTYSSQYLGVKTGGETVVLASDNLVAYEAYGFPFPSSLSLDPPADLLAHQRMRTIASSIDLIIPGHDTAVFDRFPNPFEWVARIR